MALPKFQISYNPGLVIFHRYKHPVFLALIQKGEGQYEFTLNDEPYHLTFDVSVNLTESTKKNAAYKAKALIIQDGVENFFNHIK